MNLKKASGYLRRLAFRASRAVVGGVPGGTISAFGSGNGKIGKILIVNLERQPARLRRTLRELRRFRTSDGMPLTAVARRMPAVDARDGRAVAATVDVDATYRLGHQVYVQPDARLEQCFDADEPIRMTPQEVAVARSHIEAWKCVAAGQDGHVLVLEDDVWFRGGAARAIDRGWLAARRRCSDEGEPRFLYLSYEDAGGTAQRADACDALFRPQRGIWFLSGYILSRAGAETLLRAMPVVGPVDMWVNYRLIELGALALSSPAILQRRDGDSDNSYSILPFLARAGIVDACEVKMAPGAVRRGRVLAWTCGGDAEGTAMALSMLGLRVRMFDGDEVEIPPVKCRDLLKEYDALVDAPLSSAAFSEIIARKDITFVQEANAEIRYKFSADSLPTSRTVILPPCLPGSERWKPLCTALGLPQPVENFPAGAPRSWRVFRDDRQLSDRAPVRGGEVRTLDDSPWILSHDSSWKPMSPIGEPISYTDKRLVTATMTSASPSFTGLAETFPGNLASFTRNQLVYDDDGAHLILCKAQAGSRPYCSGAFASATCFQHGRFEAEIKAARGNGLITGFFLHRDSPFQEIDVEFPGNDPQRMLINVYFNPGDDGARMGFGYRGTPCCIPLGFDASLDYHKYAIDWRPGRITWWVDGRLVHERVGWDPTPVPYLPMRLNGNLWAPRSEELAGQIEEDALPSGASFRNVSVWA